MFDRVPGTDPQSDRDRCRVIATTMPRIYDMALAIIMGTYGGDGRCRRAMVEYSVQRPL